jgi:hypothetical protein
MSAGNPSFLRTCPAQSRVFARHLNLTVGYVSHWNPARRADRCSARSAERRQSRRHEKSERSAAANSRQSLSLGPLTTSRLLRSVAAFLELHFVPVNKDVHLSLFRSPFTVTAHPNMPPAGATVNSIKSAGEVISFKAPGREPELVLVRRPAAWVIHPAANVGRRTRLRMGWRTWDFSCRSGIVRGRLQIR